MEHTLVRILMIVILRLQYSHVVLGPVTSCVMQTHLTASHRQTYTENKYHYIALLFTINYHNVFVKYLKLGTVLTKFLVFDFFGGRFLDLAFLKVFFANNRKCRIRIHLFITS